MDPGETSPYTYLVSGDCVDFRPSQMNVEIARSDHRGAVVTSQPEIGLAWLRQSNMTQQIYRSKCECEHDRVLVPHNVTALLPKLAK